MEEDIEFIKKENLKNKDKLIEELKTRLSKLGWQNVYPEEIMALLTFQCYFIWIYPQDFYVNLIFAKVI